MFDSLSVEEIGHRSAAQYALEDTADFFDSNSALR
jgi:hypothetical protein